MSFKVFIYFLSSNHEVLEKYLDTVLCLLLINEVETASFTLHCSEAISVCHKVSISISVHEIIV